MSNFHQLTKHPQTGDMEMAEWLDDFFGHHRYGIRFSDKRVYHKKEIEVSGDTDSSYDVPSSMLTSDRQFEGLFDKCPRCGSLSNDWCYYGSGEPEASEDKETVVCGKCSSIFGTNVRPLWAAWKP